MSLAQEIDSLLDQWLKLTHAEGAAIQTADWPQVKRVQADKARVRQCLSERQQLLGDTSRFAPRIGRLISLETRNGELLAAQLRRLRQEKETLDQAAKNLRRIQRSYVLRQPRATLNSYS